MNFPDQLSGPERYSATRHRVRPRTPRSASSLQTTRRHRSSNRRHASPPALPGGRYHPTNSGTPRQIYAVRAAIDNGSKPELLPNGRANHPPMQKEDPDPQPVVSEPSTTALQSSAEQVLQPSRPGDTKPDAMHNAWRSPEEIFLERGSGLSKPEQKVCKSQADMPIICDSGGCSGSAGATAAGD